MVDQGGMFGFFRGIHVRPNTRIDISISVRPMPTKFSRQVHLEELTLMRLIGQVLLTF